MKQDGIQFELPWPPTANTYYRTAMGRGKARFK
jgi:hypothetical protein